MPTLLDTPVFVTLPSPDGTFKTLDLSATVPENATGVILHVTPFNSSPLISARHPDATYDHYNQLLNNNHKWIHSGVNSAREISFKQDTGTVYMYIMGYWGQEAVFFTGSAIDVTPSSATTWEDQDITSSTDGTPVGVICNFFFSGGTANGARNIGIRKNGEASIGNGNDSNLSYPVVGCDGSGIFETYVGTTTDYNFTCIGYIKSGVDFSNTGTDQVAVAVTWEDASFSLTNGAILQYDGGGLNRFYSVSHDEAKFSTYKSPTQNFGWATGKANGGVIRIKGANTSSNFYLLGDITADADLTLAVGGGNTTNSKGMINPMKSLVKPT